MLERFIDKVFQGDSQKTIDQANGILREYKKQGYTLTLRQLYYQFVSRGLIDNNERSYKRLGKLVTDARMAGIMDWEAIEDRNRAVSSWRINEDIDDILADIHFQFAADFWQDQTYYVEVWVEKDALSNVIERAVMPFRVPYLACKGYLSASEAYRAAKRFESAGNDGKQCLLIHLGDHDPSGLDMTRDNGDRMNLMSFNEVEVRRIALNMDQIDRYNPPPNPAKTTDSRSDDYISQYGETSWELDALEPGVVVELIRREIEPLIDPDPWAEAKEREAEGVRLLKGVRDNWPEIEMLIRDQWGESEDDDADGDPG